MSRAICRRDNFIITKPRGRGRTGPSPGPARGVRRCRNSRQTGGRRADKAIQVEGRPTSGGTGTKVEGPAAGESDGTGGRADGTAGHLDGRQRQQTGYYHQDDYILPLWCIFIILLWAASSGPGVDVRRRVRMSSAYNILFFTADGPRPSTTI